MILLKRHEAMITAIDNNIILDVLIPGEPFCRSSKALLDRHVSEGQLIICEVVYAELAAWFSSEAQLKAFLMETGIRLVYANGKALYIAGSKWAAYTRKSNKTQFSCSKCGNNFEIICPQCSTKQAKRLHVLADFLIGAHAVVQADLMLTRDLGIYRTYFKDLKVEGSI
jgi:predicted nucleic acid-binding protein